MTTMNIETITITTTTTTRSVSCQYTRTRENNEYNSLFRLRRIFSCCETELPACWVTARYYLTDGPRIVDLHPSTWSASQCTSVECSFQRFEKAPSRRKNHIMNFQADTKLTSRRKLYFIASLCAPLFFEFDILWLY